MAMNLSVHAKRKNCELANILKTLPVKERVHKRVNYLMYYKVHHVMSGGYCHW